MDRTYPVLPTHRAIQPCLRMSCAVLAIRAAIGAAIREHGIALGNSRFGVDFNPSRNPRIADSKRRAADLIDAIETIVGENPPSEIARFKALTVTDIEAVAMWTAKAAARGTPSTSSPRHTGRATAPDAAARWRRSSGPQAASTRPHPRRPRRPYAAPLRAHIGASRHPVLTPLPQATLSHQTLLNPGTPAFAYPDPRGAPCTGRLDGSPRARNHPRRRRKYPKCRPCRIDAHDNALRARHAPRAQRTPQHRRFDYNILWPGRFIIAESG